MGGRPDALHFYCFCCVVRFWNSLLTTNNALLIKINKADLLLASMCWWMELSKQGYSLLVVSNKDALFHLCFSLCTSMMLIA